MRGSELRRDHVVSLVHDLYRLWALRGIDGGLETLARLGSAVESPLRARPGVFICPIYPLTTFPTTIRWTPR